MPDNFREKRLLLAEKYYWEQSDGAKTIQILNKMLSDDPDDPEALSLLAFVLYRQNEYDQAEQLCIPLLFRSEYSARAKLDLGRIAFARGEKNKAFHWFAECLKEYPNNPITLAWYARASQWGSLAQQAAQEAEKVAQKNLQILSIIFFAYHEQEKDTIAERRVLNEMLESLSANAQLYFNLYILEKENDKETAYALLTQYKKEYPEDSTYDLLYESYGKEQISGTGKHRRTKMSDIQVTDKETSQVKITCLVMILLFMSAFFGHIVYLQKTATNVPNVPVFSMRPVQRPVVPQEIEPYLPGTEFFSREGEKRVVLPNAVTTTDNMNQK